MAGILVVATYEKDDPEYPCLDDKEMINVNLAKEHYSAFQDKGYEVFICGPSNYGLETLSGFRGEPVKGTILNVIETELKDKDKVIYIDDHSLWSEGLMSFLLDPNHENEDQHILWFSELVDTFNNSGTGTQTVIVRGNQSGRALSLCDTNRMVYCSMRENQNLGICTIDGYNLSEYIRQGMTIDQAHTAEYHRLWEILHRQEPVKCPTLPNFMLTTMKP